MRRFVAVALAAVMLGGVSTPVWASEGERQAEQAFVDLINQERTTRGLGSLPVYWDLEDDARAHSAEMAAAGDIWHNPDLASVTTDWYMLGENVGMGPTVSALHEAFMNSPAHRDNVLRPEWNYLGVGVVIDEEGIIFVTVVFMQGPDGLVGDSYEGFFRDDDASPHRGAIDALAAAGVVRGCNPPANDRFCPDDPLTRGQMAAMLVRALGLPSATGNQFSDAQGSVFRADIDALAEAGIARGCAPGRYCPDRALTRGELAAFLARALELPRADGAHFTDLDGSVFAGDVNALAARGLTQGCGPDRFCPDRPITRGEMATFLWRATGSG